MLGKHRSEETKRKISESNKDKPKSEEHKASLSKAWETRVPMSKESRLKQSKSSKGKINIKKYKLIDPYGKEYVTDKGLTLFCEEHNLQRSCLLKVLKGERKHHKNWRINYDN